MVNQSVTTEFKIQADDAWAYLAEMSDPKKIAQLFSEMMDDAILATASSDFVTRTYLKAAAENDRGEGPLSHMFDYSQWAGQGSKRLDPKRQLWTTVFDGREGSLTRTLEYKFVQSRRPVPKITMKNDRVPAKNNSKLKDQPIFKNKAVVIESGRRVNIRPKNGNKAIFIPRDRLPNKIWRSKNIHNDQPFIYLTGGTSMTPGKKNKGMFTKHFIEYWEGRGMDAAQAWINKEFINRFEKDMKMAAAKRGGWYNGSATFVNATESKSKGLHEKLMRRYSDQIYRDDGTREVFG